MPPFNPFDLWRRSSKFRYLMIGGWNTLVGYGIFAGLYLLLGRWTGYVVTALLCHIIAVTQSFVTQRWLVFRSAGHWTHEYLRFHIAHLATLIIGLGCLGGLVEFFGTPPLIAQAIVTLAIAIFSYFAHRHFTFRQHRDD